MSNDLQNEDFFYYRIFYQLITNNIIRVSLLGINYDL